MKNTFRLNIVNNNYTNYKYKKTKIKNMIITKNKLIKIIKLMIQMQLVIRLI